MLLERTKIPTSKSALRPISVEIRCRANLLPFKALIYAISCAVLKSPKSSKVRLREQYRNLASTIKVLNSYADRFYSATPPPGHPSGPSSEPDPYSMTDTIKSAVDNYVSLFYSMNTTERSAYIKAMSSSKHRVKKESNLLFIPAIFAEEAEEQKFVKAGLFKHLYSMPFKMLYNTSKSGLRVMLLQNQNGMSTRAMNYEMVHEFSKMVSMLDSRILEIGEGRISPIKDEELKGTFIEQAAKMSKETDINIVEIISDRVRTESHIMKEAQRLMRRAVHVKAH